MNTTRCPWCGKIIDKEKDKTEWKDRLANRSVSRQFHLAKCSHCGHKYGQAFTSPYMLTIWLSGSALFILGLVLQFIPLLFAPILVIVLGQFAPYSKLDEDCSTVEKREELMCDLEIVERCGKITPYEIYFLEDNFDSFEPFILASPIQIDRVSKKKGVASGSFLYMNEKNYNYIDSDICNLYNTDMVLVANVKIK